jgi:hypothetical protein
LSVPFVEPEKKEVESPAAPITIAAEDKSGSASSQIQRESGSLARRLKVFRKHLENNELDSALEQKQKYVA